MDKKLKQCGCEAWQFSMSQIKSAYTLAYAHGIKYTGLQFEYCPWCGKKREEELIK